MAKTVEKLTDVKNDWNWYVKKPIAIKATELEEEIEIKTREGVLKGYPGDFLIQGIEGELYPCGREIFFKTYEKYTGNLDENDSV